MIDFMLGQVFHEFSAGQNPNPVGRAGLAWVSGGFRELKGQAAAFLQGTSERYPPQAAA